MDIGNWTSVPQENEVSRGIRFLDLIAQQIVDGRHRQTMVFGGRRQSGLEHPLWWIGLRALPFQRSLPKRASAIAEQENDREIGPANSNRFGDTTQPAHDEGHRLRFEEW